MELKKQIIEQASKLFNNYGIKSNTMDDIAREVGISKKTLYMHVKDKNDLIEQVIDNDYKRFDKKVKEISNTSADPIEQLMRLNILIAKLLKDVNPVSIYDLSKHYKTILEKNRDRYQKSIFNEIIGNIKKGKALKIYREDINEGIITKLHSDRISNIIDTHENWKDLEITSESIKEMTIYYIRGLLNDKGQDLLDEHINEFNKYLNE